LHWQDGGVVAGTASLQGGPRARVLAARHERAAVASPSAGPGAQELRGPGARFAAHSREEARLWQGGSTAGARAVDKAGSRDIGIDGAFLKFLIIYYVYYF